MGEATSRYGWLWAQGVLGQLVAGLRGSEGWGCLAAGRHRFQHSWLCSLVVPGPVWVPGSGWLEGGAGCWDRLLKALWEAGVGASPLVSGLCPHETGCVDFGVPGPGINWLVGGAGSQH